MGEGGSSQSSCFFFCFFLFVQAQPPYQVEKLSVVTILDELDAV